MLRKPLQYAGAMVLLGATSFALTITEVTINASGQATSFKTSGGNTYTVTPSDGMTSSLQGLKRSAAPVVITDINSNGAIDGMDTIKEQ